MQQDQQPAQDPHKGYVPAPTLYGNQAPSRAVEDTTIDAETAARHKASIAQYPQLNLSAGEYVIDSVSRHPIGLLSIWIVAGLLIFITLALLPFYAMNQSGIASTLGIKVATLPTAMTLTVPDLILAAFFALGGFVATVVYEGNKFYLTNESVIQHLRFSLFHTKIQIINLVNVEDASFDQRGIIQQLFNYGTLRLSTEGRNTIYRFFFVANPNHVVNEVNDAVEIAIQKIEGGGVPAHKFLQ